MNRNRLLLFLGTVQGMSGASLYALKIRKHRWINRRWWVHPINCRREELGHFRTLFEELKQDPQLFFRYTRMDMPTFNNLLNMTSKFLQNNSIRASICPEQRLIVNLRYLATGESMFSMALAYRMGESTVRQIINETCEVIIKVLKPLYLEGPTSDEWRNICLGFLHNWNLPNCVGALDGKHIVIQAPPNSGSIFFNYKKTFSVVLMAACDDKYKFTLCDVRAYSSESDGGVLSRSSFGRALKEKYLKLPEGTACLPGSNLRTACYFVGDEAFQMSLQVMRPYPGRHLDDMNKIFNYRLSRARRVIENSFEILVARWRVFRRPICALPDTVNNMVLSSLCLHNFLMVRNDTLPSETRMYCPPKFVDIENLFGEILPGEWRQSGQHVLGSICNGAHRATQAAYAMRDHLAQYFCTPPGSIPWQYEYVQRGRHGP